MGERVETPDGTAKVVAHDVPRDEVVLKLDAGGGRSVCSRADACAARAAYVSRG